MSYKRLIDGTALLEALGHDDQLWNWEQVIEAIESGRFDIPSNQGEAARLREVKDRINHFYLQLDGSFAFPNSKEGDLLKMVNKALSSPTEDKGIQKVREDDHDEE